MNLLPRENVIGPSEALPVTDAGKSSSIPLPRSGIRERLIDGYYSLVNRLARVTTSGRRIRELDGLRFIAIATVFIQHTFEVVYPHYAADHRHVTLVSLILDSRIGVELFFLISGFILASPFAAQHILGEKPVNLKGYYWRRLTRLEPPYLLSLVLCYAALIFFWRRSASFLLPHLAASALYLHNVVYHGISRINSVAWSLEVEVQFYVVAPLLALVFCIRRKWLRRTILLGGTLAYLQFLKLLQHLSPFMPDTLIRYLPFFLMGFVLADIYLVDWKQEPRGSLWCDTLALVGWLALPLWFQRTIFFHGNVLPASGFPFLLLALCWLSFRSIYIRKVLASSFVMTVGGMCYSIYLLHLPLLRILSVYSPVPLLGQHPGLTAPLYCFIWGVPVLAVSIAYFMLIEKPCMQKDWPRHLRDRLRRHHQSLPETNPRS